MAGGLQKFVVRIIRAEVTEEEEEEEEEEVEKKYE